MMIDEIKEGTEISASYQEASCSTAEGKCGVQVAWRIVGIYKGC